MGIQRPPQDLEPPPATAPRSSAAAESPPSADPPIVLQLPADSEPLLHRSAGPLNLPRSAVECTCRTSREGRNLVLCIDGTANQFSRMNSNIVELYSLLEKTPTQLTYYNSGIGTHVKHSTGWRSWMSPAAQKQALAHAIDMAVASNFEVKVLAAYQWLVENYQDGDRIFLFGFSRGAYQVRVIAGMLHLVGLLHKGNNEQIKFAYELYRNSISDDTRNIDPQRAEKPLCDHFKRTLSRPNVRAHFVGAWDTVSSVGFLRERMLPETITGMKHVCAFRHALALDEKRVKFLPEFANGGGSPSGGHIKEVWFSGSHSDIGGGNIDNPAVNRFGPSLRWMSYEAILCGLRMVPHVGEWKPIPLTDSMTWVWRVLEYIPYFVPRLSYKSQDDIERWHPHCARPRRILENQLIHQSVFKEMQPSGDGRQGYQPSPQPPMPYHAWNEIQHDSGIIEKDPYMAVGDILSHIGNTTDSHVLQTAVSSEYLHVLRTALSSGEVGRLAILSNPEAQDNLIRAALKECQLAAEGPDPQETVFEVLMETLSIFETAPNDHEKAEVHVAGLLTVLEAFLKLDPPLNSIPSTRYTRLKDTIIRSFYVSSIGIRKQEKKERTLEQQSIPSSNLQRKSRQLFALIVGIDTYKFRYQASGSGNFFPNLCAPVIDAHAVTNFLVKDIGIAANNIKTLFDEEATHDNIVKELTSFVDDPRIKRGDSILFYFAGHCLQNKSVDLLTPILLPYDTHFPHANESNTGTATISYGCLTDIIQQLYIAYGANITIIMDCNNPFPSKSDLAVLRNHASSSSPQDRDHTSSTHLDRASPSPPNLDLAPTSNQTPYSDRLNKMMTENSFPLSNRSDPFFEDVAEHLSRLDAGLHWKKLNNDRGSAQPTGPNGVFRPSVDIASHDLRSFGPPDTHMVLMACDSNELCRETQKGGFFTTALLKVLKANKNLTYAQIMDRMDDIPHQTPQLEGYHRDRRIFDFEDLPAPSVDR